MILQNFKIKIDHFETKTTNVGHGTRNTFRHAQSCENETSDKLKFSNKLNFWVKAQFSFLKLHEVKQKRKVENKKGNPINADCCIAYKFIAYHGTRRRKFLHRRAEALEQQRRRNESFLSARKEHSDSNISITFFFYYFPHDRFWDFNHEFVFWQRLRSRWKVSRTKGAGCRLLNNTLAKALGINQKPLKLNLRLTPLFVASPLLASADKKQFFFLRNRDGCNEWGIRTSAMTWIPSRNHDEWERDWSENQGNDRKTEKDDRSRKSCFMQLSFLLRSKRERISNISDPS